MQIYEILVWGPYIEGLEREKQGEREREIERKVERKWREGREREETAWAASGVREARIANIQVQEFIKCNLAQCLWSFFLHSANVWDSTAHHLLANATGQRPKKHNQHTMP